VAGRPADVSQPPAEPAHLPPVSGQQVRSHAAELVQLAGRHGIAALAFASPGPLRGHVADNRDLSGKLRMAAVWRSVCMVTVLAFRDGQRAAAAAVCLASRCSTASRLSCPPVRLGTAAGRAGRRVRLSSCGAP